jgi:hypothetical protein
LSRLSNFAQVFHIAPHDIELSMQRRRFAPQSTPCSSTSITELLPPLAIFTSLLRLRYRRSSLSLIDCLRLLALPILGVVVVVVVDVFT